MGTEAVRHMIDFCVIGRQHSTLHGGDMVGEKRTERADIAERSALLAIERRTHRLAVVLEKIESMLVAERSQHIERARVTQYTDRDHHPGARRKRLFELGN